MAEKERIIDFNELLKLPREKFIAQLKSDEELRQMLTVAAQDTAIGGDVRLIEIFLKLDEQIVVDEVSLIRRV